MSRRTLLSSEQRTRLFGIPSDAAEMATHYVLEPEDLALVRAKRRPSNRGQESGGGFDRRSGVTILELLRAEIAQC